MEFKCLCWYFINFEISIKSIYGKVFVKILKYNVDEGKIDWKRYLEACLIEKAFVKFCVVGIDNVEYIFKLFMWFKN